MTVAPAFVTPSANSGVRFEPTRAAGLARLDAFVPHAGRQCAERRNFDFGRDQSDNVSRLSPWVRHRLVHEDEVIRSVLGRQSFRSAEEFIQEVAWRTYWKGCPTEMLSSEVRAEDVIDWARSAWVDEIVTGYVPVCPTRDWLDDLRAPLDRAGISLTTLRRTWDHMLGPHATKGFFPFKEKLPSARRTLGIG